MNTSIATESPCECGNCDWVGAMHEALDLNDFWSRIEPGETMPAGDCPECGAFVFPAEVKAKLSKPDQLAHLVATGDALADVVEAAQAALYWLRAEAAAPGDAAPGEIIRVLEAALGEEPEADPELPSDIPSEHDTPNRHGVAWVIEWKRGGSSSGQGCKSFAWGRAWLQQAARRFGESIPEAAIPATPDGYVGWSWESAKGAKYSIRRAR